MAVSLDEPWGGYGPPKLSAGSPPAPTGRTRPLRNDRVFVDSNVIYGTDCRLPLLLLAGSGLLTVHWSPYVAAEIARVATREQALAVVRTNPALLGQELEARRREIDRVVADHERHWHSPSPTALRAVHREIPPDAVSDPNDLPILASALATDAAFLLTTNEHHFPHGQAYQGVVFWHPDTFLTAYFEDAPEAYIFVRDEMPGASAAFGARLRP